MNILKREGFENNENDHQQLIVFILLQTLLTNSLRKYMEMTWENLSPNGRGGGGGVGVYFHIIMGYKVMNCSTVYAFCL